jgi:outer membrane biogenesis lipoprotein LolB
MKQKTTRRFMSNGVLVLAVSLLAACQLNTSSVAEDDEDVTEAKHLTVS